MSLKVKKINKFCKVCFCQKRITCFKRKLFTRNEEQDNFDEIASGYFYDSAVTFPWLATQFINDGNFFLQVIFDVKDFYEIFDE